MEQVLRPGNQCNTVIAGYRGLECARRGVETGWEGQVRGPGSVALSASPVRHPADPVTPGQELARSTLEINDEGWDISL